MARDPFRFYKIEAQELVEKLNSGFLALEGDVENIEVINELFRHAHTLKGASRLVKLHNIGEISHLMEDQLDDARKSELMINSAHIDRFLTAMETVKKIIDLLVDGQDPHIEVSSTIALLSQPDEASQSPSDKPPNEPDVIAQPQPEMIETVVAVPTVQQVTATPQQQMHKDPVAEQPAESVAAAAQSQPRHDKSNGDDSIRMEVKKINAILNLSGELAINKIRLEDKMTQLKKVSGLGAANRELAEHWRNISGSAAFQRLIANEPRLKESCLHIHQSLQQQNDIREQLQKTVELYEDDLKATNNISMRLMENAYKARMLPAETIFPELQRLTRSVARELGKDVSLDCSGGHLQIDKQILDEMKSPLMHLLRNAIDHGIENANERAALSKSVQGRIGLKISHQGANLRIVVEDDGGGVDNQKVRDAAVKLGIITADMAEQLSEREILYLMMKPGLSSAPIITSISGRGVGLDVVNESITQLRGNITIDTELTKFTRFNIELPQSLASMNCLQCECAGQRILLPLWAIKKTMRISVNEFSTEGNQEVLLVDDNAVPVVRLQDVLEITSEDVASGHKLSVVILHCQGDMLALVVDKLQGVHDVIVKHLGNHIKKVPKITGVTISGDGRTTVILDVVAIVYEVLHSKRFKSTSALGPLVGNEQKQQQRILVVDDSLTTRIMEQSILESAGYQVDLAVSAEDALDGFDESNYDLIMSDVEMPGLNGFELTARFRSMNVELPIIIVSSLSTAESKRKGIDAGAQAYIVKGEFEQDHLLDTIEQLI